MISKGDLVTKVPEVTRVRVKGFKGYKEPC